LKKLISASRIKNVGTILKNKKGGEGIKRKKRKHEFALTLEFQVI